MAQLESTTTMANAIKDHFMPGFVEGVYRQDRTLDALRSIGFTERVAPGGTNVSWLANTSANSSVGVFTEGQAAPQSVAQGWSKPQLSWVYYWAYVTITGHALDAMKDGGWFDTVNAAMMLAQRDIVDLRNTTMLGSTNNGLQAAISATTTYAGITRGSAAWFESSTSSSTFSVANLRALYRTMRDADKGGSLTACIASPTVCDIYAGLVGTPAAQTNATLSYVAAADGSPPSYDLGYRLGGLGFMGAPIIEMPDLTSSVMLLLDARGCEHVVIRPFDVSFYANQGDGRVFKLTTGSTLVVPDPKRSAVYTSIS